MPFNPESLELENAFFVKEDELLIAKLRQLKAMEETKEALSKVSGITNDRILGHLVELKVRPETLAALAAVPMVVVAWADGKLDSKERVAILTSLQNHKILPGSVEYDLVMNWLNHKPNSELLETWKHYVHGLAEQLPPDERLTLKQEWISAAQGVAESSGGFLGFGNKVSEQEQKVLAQLSQAFT